MPTPPPVFVLASLLALSSSLACNGNKRSLAESLEKMDEEPEGDDSVQAKPRPRGLDGPTDEEFAAWNRKDPEGEKHLYKWDKAHMKEMLLYWHDLECFHEKVQEEGKKAFGAEPGSEQSERWFQFKRAFAVHMDSWQKRLFAEQPRVLEKSKFVGNFLEAHELILNGYLQAYNDADEKQLKKQDAHWAIVEAKNKKYTKSLGESWPERDLSKPKVAKAHAKFCAEAMSPKQPGASNRRRRSGSGKKRTQSVKF